MKHPEEERTPDLPGQLLMGGGEVRGDQGLLFREGSPPERRAQRILPKASENDFWNMLRKNFRRGPKEEEGGLRL